MCHFCNRAKAIGTCVSPSDLVSIYQRSLNWKDQTAREEVVNRDVVRQIVVSEINKGLNEQVEAFCNRSLQEVYSVVWAETMYEKIRMNGRVVRMAVLIVRGINLSGIQEILVLEPMYEESKESYTLIFNRLKERVLKNAWLVVSDAHEGLKEAAVKCFLGSSL